MKQLTLSIKRKPFDDILSGAQKEETRNVWPTNEKKLVAGYRVGEKVYESVFDAPNDCEIDETIPREYDTLKLYTGAYSGKRPYMVVEVKGARVGDYVDDDGEVVMMDVDGVGFPASFIVYELGEVLEVNLAP